MAFDVFMKMEGIDGECTDDKHADWVEILSFSHAVTQSGSGSVSSGGSRTAERCDHSDFSIVKSMDKASPKLALYCSNGEHIPTVLMELCRAGGDKNVYMKYTLEDAVVTSYSPGGSAQGGEALPMEEVSFAYGKIKWTYTETDHATGKPKGNVEAHWDLHLNTGG
ncbi:MAG: type VI secretion system tube protein Hcp [Desulfosarcina sp.]|nr:type VI secretion system tube protein Hcp [Desulfosarcina sp.]